MSVEIAESGMVFGPFSEDDFFHLEKSAAYGKIAQNVKIAEFSIVKRDAGGRALGIYIIEAKSSSPQPATSDKQATSDKFSNFIVELQEKFTNALTLVVAMHLERHEPETLPSGFMRLDWKTTPFTMIAIIRGHKSEWLAPIRDELQKNLAPFAKALGCGKNPVLVLNDELAKDRRLIQ